MRGRFASTYGRLAGITAVLVVLCCGMPSDGCAGESTYVPINEVNAAVESPYEYISGRTSPAFSQDNLVAFDDVKVYPTPHLDKPPVSALKAGTKVIILRLCPEAVCNSSEAGDGPCHFVYEVECGGKTGFVRAVDILRVKQDNNTTGIIRNTVGCEKYIDQICLDSLWLNVRAGQYKLLGTELVVCGWDEVSRSPGGSYFFTYATPSPDFSPQRAPRIYSSSGEVVFKSEGCGLSEDENDIKKCFDSPTWMDDENVLLREDGKSDAVYILNATTGFMFKLLEYPGKEAGYYYEDDCWIPPTAVEYDREKNQLKAVFLRYPNNDENSNKIDEITVTFDMSGRILSEDKITDDNSN